MLTRTGNPVPSIYCNTQFFLSNKEIGDFPDAPPSYPWYSGADHHRYLTLFQHNLTSRLVTSCGNTYHIYDSAVYPCWHTSDASRVINILPSVCLCVSYNSSAGTNRRSYQRSVTLGHTPNNTLKALPVLRLKRTTAPFKNSTDGEYPGNIVPLFF